MADIPAASAAPKDASDPSPAISTPGQPPATSSTPDTAPAAPAAPTAPPTASQPHDAHSSTTTSAPAPAPAAPGTPIPADDHLTPAPELTPDPTSPGPDDGYASGTESGSSRASTSLASHVRDYSFENRRRYHRYKEGQYHFPNDDDEQEREDTKHTMVVHLCGGQLHSAPLKNPQRIIDVGTGTGIWAIDMGDEYPEAEIIGVDLSPIQPEFVPPNVRFMVDDAEVEWVYPDNHFDFVHLRNMAPSIKKWPELFAEAYRVTKPGGWIELQEMRWVYGCDDKTMPPTFAPVKMVANIKEALAKLDVEMNAAELYPAHVAAAGFVNLAHEVKKVPVGPWAKDDDLKKIGEYCRAAIYDGLHAITIGPFTRGLGWTPEEVEVFLIEVRRDLLDRSVHSYVHFHTLAAQKPLDG
ncbi:TAM domain methyltransferase [Colletotrichum cuscutae]|uniref:TAM domain methyltransferase n=1 Tax=Colletotrichum cuscutae TaxID=1209917 RepID=A0AAI9VAG2_9PEZI|nr:TAM domain methyltransferase [Colletotrichum cuscutae]